VARWCLGLWAGQLRARGASYHPALENKVPWFALATGPEIAFSGRSARFNAALTPSVPLRRTEVALGHRTGGLVITHTLPQLGVMLWLGVSYGAPAKVAKNSPPTPKD
jgi:hypothetical protein